MAGQDFFTLHKGRAHYPLSAAFIPQNPKPSLPLPSLRSIVLTHPYGARSGLFRYPPSLSFVTAAFIKYRDIYPVTPCHGFYLCGGERRAKTTPLPLNQRFVRTKLVHMGLYPHTGSSYTAPGALSADAVIYSRFP
jgi:hypothetical protein